MMTWVASPMLRTSRVSRSVIGGPTRGSSTRLALSPVFRTTALPKPTVSILACRWSG